MKTRPTQAISSEGIASLGAGKYGFFNDAESVRRWLTEKRGYTYSEARSEIKRWLERFRLDYEQENGWVCVLPYWALKLATGFNLPTPPWAADAILDAEHCRQTHQKLPRKMRPPSRKVQRKAEEDLVLFVKVNFSRDQKKCSLENAFAEVVTAEEQAGHFIAETTVRNAYYRAQRRLGPVPASPRF